jgi:hypothetical protein
VIVSDDTEQANLPSSQIPSNAITIMDEKSGDAPYIAQHDLKSGSILQYSDVNSPVMVDSHRKWYAVHDLDKGSILTPRTLTARPHDKVEDEEKMEALLGRHQTGVWRQCVDAKDWLYHKLTKSLKKGEPITEEYIGERSIRGAVAARALPAGHVIEEGDLTFRYFPAGDDELVTQEWVKGTGNSWIGLTLGDKKVKAGQPIKYEDLSQ